MKTHTVQKGECLASISKKYGFRRWRTIYEAPENAEFRDKRPNPNVLYAGDKIVIPEFREKQVSAATEARHKFKVKSKPWIFKIEMRDESFQPLEDVPFEIQIQGMKIRKGRTGPNGLIQVPINPEAKTGKLSFMGEEFDLAFGMLDPISTVTGVQARLNNLGFKAGALDGVVGPKTWEAVYDFQSSQPDLEATGEINDATRAALLKRHDGDDVLTDAEENMDFQD